MVSICCTICNTLIAIDYMKYAPVVKAQTKKSQNGFNLQL